MSRITIDLLLDLVESPGIAEFFQSKLNTYRHGPLDHVVTVPRPDRFWGI